MKPFAIVFNDIHLKPGNEHAVLKSVRHMINHGLDIGIHDIILAGDLFDSRSFQRQSVLQTFDKICQMMSDTGMRFWVIPGNHDKTEYREAYSFLEVFRHHPCVRFFHKTEVIDIKGITITLIPFFSDDVLVPMLDEAEPADILISHFEMAGSTYLGKVSTKETITRSMLKKWKKVYLGHYHNTHEITKDIIHMPSLRQTNFGEDAHKGFTVLYDDLSYEIIKGDFREFNKISIDIDSTTMDEVRSLVKTHENSENIVRFEFTGDEAKLKALDKAMFRDAKIDVKFKFTTKFDSNNVEMPKATKKHDQNTVTKTFEQFCDEKGYDIKVGKKYLDEFLDSKK